MEEAHYYLSTNVFLCLDEQHYVVLDLRRDQYLCVERDKFDLLTPLFAKHLARTSPESIRALSAEGESLASQLIQRGVLTTTPDSGKPVILTHVLQPSRSLAGRRARLCPEAVVHAVPFILASQRANNLLGKYPLQDAVNAVRERKRHAQLAGHIFDARKATKLVEAFNTLRSFFPRNYLCLFDSLALVEFLARYKLYPTWVFAVHANPFTAHCWVQEGDLALDETIEELQAYKPIMAV